MRIALFSDIHGNVTGLKAVLADIDSLGGADILVAAGDIVGGGPGTEDLLDIMIERKIRMVRGDNEEILRNTQEFIHYVPDKWKRYTYETNKWLRSRLSRSYQDLLASLPLYEILELGRSRNIFICHATPKSAWEEVCAYANPTTTLRNAYSNVEADIIAYGHEHKHHVLWLDSKLLLNVASVGLRRDSLSSWTLVECIDEHLVIQQHQVPYDSDEERKLILERDVPQPTVIFSEMLPCPSHKSP